MSKSTPRRLTGWLPFLLVLGAIMALAAGAIEWVVTPPGSSQAATVAPARNVGSVPSTSTSTAHATTLALVDPDRIEIPKLSVNAPIVPVGTLPGGALDVPLNPRTVGWWSGGVEPGAATGTAILAGHINYSGVQGALAQIGTLDPGDRVYVDGTRNGKSTREAFTITGVRTYDKKALPYQQIFDQKSVGRLAIVTCGGPFDASTGNYLDNIVAYAVPVS